MDKNKITKKLKILYFILRGSGKFFVIYLNNCLLLLLLSKQLNRTEKL